MKFRFLLTCFIIISLLAVGLQACKKQEYYTDGGKSNPVSPLSNYDYLKSHQYHYFDTLILIIDHYGLKDSVNKAGTFFAFTDYSVNRFMQLNQYTSLEQMYDSLSSRFLTQYMFQDSGVSLSQAKLVTTVYPNWSKDTFPTGIKKVLGSFSEPVGVNQIFYYYTLQYVKIQGKVDDAPGRPDGDPNDYVIPCQTADIKTSGGATTLHIQANNAFLLKLR